MERFTKEWINDLKIAIINDDIHKIEEYSTRDVPKFSSIEEAKEALSLLNQIKSNLNKQKTQLSKQMQEIKQARKYANSYSNNSTNHWNA